MTDTLNDTTTRRTSVRWGIVALLFFSTVINYLDRQNLSILARTIQDDLKISDIQYSYVVQAFLLAYTITSTVIYADQARIVGATIQDSSVRTALFARIEKVYNSPEKAKLTPEQQRLTWYYYTNFARAGAKLDPAAKKLIAQGILDPAARVVAVLTGNVLKDPDYIFKYHTGQLKTPGGELLKSTFGPPGAPPTRPFVAPKVSYCLRFSGSDRTP